MTWLSPAVFVEGFAHRFDRSAYRLELLDYYVSANESDPYQRFLAGQPQDPAWREPWKHFVRNALDHGKIMARVHVVSESLNDYLRFELTCAYPANVEAGEDVRILAWRNAPSSLPDHDYWLFDDAVAAAMHYDADGNWTGAEMTTDPARLRRYCQARDRAMERAVPLFDYLKTLGLKEAV